MRLFECLEQIWQNDDLSKHAMLIGEGGSGKTTQLKKLWHDLSHNSALDTPIAIYVPLYGFNGSDTYIQDYILQEYCGHSKSSDTDQTRKNDLLLLFKQTDDLPRRFVLLLDGINEAQNWNELVYEIKSDLCDCDNLQIVISSRYKLNDFNDFTQLQVKPLTVDFVKSKLKEDPQYKDYQFSDKLLSLLTNPMYLSMFLGLGLDIPEIETENITSPGEIFKANNDRLIKTVLHNLNKSETSELYLKREYCFKYLLPYCAAHINKVAFSRTELINALIDADSYLFFVCNEKYLDISFSEEGKISARQKAKKIIDDVLITSNIIQTISDEQCKFSHENYLQFYVALYYYNEMTLCPDNQCPTCLTDSLIDENLLSWIGELFGEHNFMRKTTLQESDSPLESWLHNHCEIDKSNCTAETLARATRNVVEIIKVARKNNLTADYSDLDLTMCDFYGCPLPNSNFENARISKTCFVSEGHSSGILALTISPDKTMLASVGRDGLIKIWDVATGVNFKTLKYSRYVSDRFLSNCVTLSISADNRKLFLYADDKVMIWDNMQNNINVPKQIKLGWPLAISANGDKIASIGIDGSIHINNLSNGQEHIFYITDEAIISPYHRVRKQLSFSRDGKHLIIVDMDKNHIAFCIYGVEENVVLCKQNISIHSCGYPRLICSDCGKYFAFFDSLGGDNYCEIWSLESVNNKFELKFVGENHFNYKIKNIAFLNDEIIVLDSSGKLERICFLSQSKNYKTSYISTQIIKSAFSIDGSVIAIANENNTVETISVKAGNLTKATKSFKKLIYGIGYDDNDLLVLEYLNSLQFIDTKNEKVIKTLTVNSDGPITISKNGICFVADSKNSLITKIDTNFYTLHCTELKTNENQVSIDQMVCSNDGKILVCREGYGSALSSYFVDCLELKQKYYLETNHTISHSEQLVFSPNDTYLASYNYEYIALWDAKTGKLLYPPIIIDFTNTSTLIGEIKSIAFYSDTQLRFVGNNTVYNLDILTKEIITVSELPRSIVEDDCEMKLSSNGNMLIIRPHTSNSVLLYEISTGKILVPLTGVKFTRKMALVKDYIYSERKKALITPLNNSTIAITHTDTSKTFYYTCLDSVNIQNSDFRNTDMSAELKELLEMNGGIVE